MYHKYKQKIYIILLILYFIIVYLLPLNSRLLWQPDETRYAEISREMLENKNWTIPYLLGVRYFEKPVAGYWINNFSQIIFGNNNFAVRLSVILSTLITTIIVYWLSTAMWHNKNVALISSLIYISMFLVVAIGSYNILDPIFTMWVSVCILSSFYLLNNIKKNKKILSCICFGIGSGMAFLTKGFLGLIIPCINIIIIMLYEKRFLELIKFSSIFILTIILIIFPWSLNIHINEPDYWHYFFWIEHIKRFLSDNAQHKSPIWFYIPVILIGTIPWLGITFGTMLNIYKKKIYELFDFYLIIWIIVPFIIFTFSKGKLLTYILPIMTPLSLLMSKFIVKSIHNNKTFFFQLNGIINIIIGIICVILFFILIFINNNLYSKYEYQKLILGIIIFLFWIIVGVCSFIKKYKYFLCNSLCSLILSISFHHLLPQSIIDNKLPQYFIQKNILILKNSDYIITDNVGWATSLAWELKKTNIFLYNNPGELKYGINYPNSNFVLIKKESIIQWIDKMKHKEKITMILSKSNKINFIYKKIKPNSMICNSKIIMLSFIKK